MIVRSGFGGVVCDKDNLLACAVVRLICADVLDKSYLSISAALTSQPCQGIDGRRTRERLSEELGKVRDEGDSSCTVAVKQKDLKNPSVMPGLHRGF